MKIVPLALAALVTLGWTPAAGAATTTTPDTARVRLGTGAGAFVAYPSGDRPAPGVVVVHEWWGLNSQIRSIALRLSRQGYVAIVPDLYGGRIAGDAETAHVLSRSLDEERAVAVLASAASWLKAQPRVAKSRIGVLGFCMGGGLAQQVALGDGALAAVVVFYGTPLPAARVTRLEAPLLGHFGANDDGISADRVEAFKAALARENKVHEIYLYAGAGHAFMNDERPSYNPDAARLAWARTLAFLQKHLKR
jgi:carboxymethylenebutenolidase